MVRRILKNKPLETKSETSLREEAVENTVPVDISEEDIVTEMLKDNVLMERVQCNRK